MVALMKNEHDTRYAEVMHGDCLAVLRAMPENSIDAIVTDPPYGLGEVKDVAGLLTAWINDEDDSRYLGKRGFMGKDWDAGVPGPRYWREVYRVMKPGSHLLAFAGTRTYDLLVIALRLSGFECRDQISWIYGSGFPKSTDISKQLDKRQGVEREVIGIRRLGIQHGSFNNGSVSEEDKHTPITAPSTPEAQQWQGYGTALKPAHEPICLARKPLSEKTIAENVLKHGTGGLAIDKCRVDTTSEDLHHMDRHQNPTRTGWAYNGSPDTPYVPHAQGRFPSNLLLSHSIWCVCKGTKRVRLGGGQPIEGNQRKGGTVYGGLFTTNSSTYHGDENGMEEVPDWECHESCPILQLDRQSGIRKSGAKHPYPNKRYQTNTYGSGRTSGVQTYEPSEGGASRYFQHFSPTLDDYPPFFYQAKASRAERNRGCEGLPEVKPLDYLGSGIDGRGQSYETKPVTNSHPTVKSIQLMRYLVRLVTPPKGVVLDPFCGSGSTGVACVYEGFRFIGIEQESSYCDIARCRVQYAMQEQKVSV